MNLSQRGLDLIQSFEGYHTAQPDGSCVAYLCPARVPTIGWGCTEGVRLGMRWTRAEADAAFLRELSKFERAVDRLVTVDLNQNEYDALVSFAYNCGEGALSKSTILKKLNKGDRTGAAAAFAAWNKGGGRVLPGLVRRRAAEADLFRDPVDVPDDEPSMPQSVEMSKVPMSPAVAHTINTAGTTVANTAVQGLPKPPPVVAESLGTFSAWQSLGRGLSTVGATVASSPVLMLLLVGLFGAMLFRSNISSYFGRK